MAGSNPALSELEIRVLHILQNQFPLVERPYSQLADALGVEEEILLECIERLYTRGLIRRFGASVNSRGLGFVSMLVAAKVKPDYIEKAASFVNSFPEITHNYLREGDYNMWFTVIAGSTMRLDEILTQIEQSPGLDKILRLPAKRVFKVSVKFPLIAG